MIVGYEHAVQISVFVKAVGLGYLIGLLFCFFSFCNALSKGAVAVFVRDVLFFILNAGVSFLFLLKYNSGVVRFYILAGEAMGFLLFYMFPGALIEGRFRGAADKLMRRLSQKTDKLKKRLADIVKGCFNLLKNKESELKERKKTVQRENKTDIGAVKPVYIKKLRKKAKKNYKNT